jgi:hypothetical protein
MLGFKWHRYKGRPSAKNIERDFPHAVDIGVPLGGFGKQLDAMHEWHRKRGIKAHQGRGQREEGQNFIRWCFISPKMAADFAAEFGGTVMT